MCQQRFGRLRPELLVYLLQMGRRDLVAELVVGKYMRKEVTDKESEEEIRDLCKILNTPLPDGSTFLSAFSEKIFANESSEDIRMALEVILECGADPNMVVPVSGLRPGHVAVMNGSLWAARLFLLAGMDVTAKSQDEKNTSVLAMASKRCPRFAEMIQKTWTGLPSSFSQRITNRRWLAVMNYMRRDLVTEEDLQPDETGCSAYERARCFGVNRIVVEMEYRYKNVLKDKIGIPLMVKLSKSGTRVVAQSSDDTLSQEDGSDGVSESEDNTGDSAEANDDNRPRVAVTPAAVANRLLRGPNTAPGLLPTPPAVPCLFTAYHPWGSPIVENNPYAPYYNGAAMPQPNPNVWPSPGLMGPRPHCPNALCPCIMCCEAFPSGDPRGYR